MNCTLNQWYPGKPHKGGRLLKPRRIDGYVNLSKNEGTFYGHDNRMAVAPLRVYEISISMDGISLLGMQGHDRHVRWWQGGKI